MNKLCIAIFSVTCFSMIVFFSSCGGGGEESGIQLLAKPLPERFNDSSFVDSTFFPSKSKKELRSGKLSMETAVALIRLLMGQQPVLSNIARYKSFGTVLPADLLKAKPGMMAARFWHCYNPQYKDNGFPEFFLALDHISGYDKKNPENLVASNREFFIGETILYDKADCSKTTVYDYLTGHQQVCAQQPQKIEGAKVKEFSENFKSLMSFISPTDADPYCRYAVSVFEYDAAFIQFMDRKPAWIRCYIGLSLDPLHDPNYLRPMLAGAHASGKLIIVKSTQDEDETFLQKSVPPPPPPY